MVNSDHEGYRKVQVWVPEELWNEIESLEYHNQTAAVTEALKALTERKQQGENISQDIPDIQAKVNGLNQLVEDKDNRIADLREQIALMNTQLDRKDDQITELNEASKKQAVHIQSLIQSNSELNLKLLPEEKIIPETTKKNPRWKFWG